MIRVFAMTSLVGIAIVGPMSPSWGHAGSSTPVPRGCHIVVEPVVIDGVRIMLRRLSCPTPKAPATS